MAYLGSTLRKAGILLSFMPNLIEMAGASCYQDLINPKKQESAWLGETIGCAGQLGTSRGQVCDSDGVSASFSMNQYSLACGIEVATAVDIHGRERWFELGIVGFKILHCNQDAFANTDSSPSWDYEELVVADDL